MAKQPFTDVEEQKQQAMKAARDKADQTRQKGNQPHEIAEKANMKRQQKKMHLQGN
jgi:hypothetical protein